MDAVQARGQRLIDAFVRSAALRATAGFCRGLESLDLPRMVPQARHLILQELLGGRGFPSRTSTVPTAAQRTSLEGLYELLLPDARMRELLGGRGATGCELLKGLEDGMARDPPQPVRSGDLAALEEVLGIERIEATWGRLRLLHAVGDQDPTTLRFLRAVVHLHIPAAESRCRFITTAGLWELGFEPWLRLPEAEQDADRARLDTDREGTEFLDKLRALGLPELLALPAQRRRELLEYWAANCGRSPPLATSTGRRRRHARWAAPSLIPAT